MTMKRVIEVLTGPERKFDPVAAAEQLGEPTDDPVKLRAENERLRAALATARRDGWIAGRDEALAVIVKRQTPLCSRGLPLTIGRDERWALEEVEAGVRALASPAREGENDE